MKGRSFRIVAALNVAVVILILNGATELGGRLTASPWPQLSMEIELVPDDAQVRLRARSIATPNVAQDRHDQRTLGSMPMI